MAELQELKQFITKDITIGDMVKQFPASAEIVTKYGVHCVGCHVSPYETLEMGLKGHGYDDAKVEQIVSEVNQALTDRNIQSASFLSVSETAAKKVQEFAQKQGMKQFYLRALMKKGGCAGRTSSLEFTEEKNADDEVIQAHGVEIIIDPESKPYLDGAIIDYVETLNSSGFKINNPTAKKSCGCGSSFSV